MFTSLSEAARKALQNMDPAKYEYQSEFARRYVAQGREEGRAEGEANLLLKLLASRFGPLPAAVEARVRASSIADLEVFAERVLAAKCLDDVFGSGGPLGSSSL